MFITLTNKNRTTERVNSRLILRMRVCMDLQDTVNGYKEVTEITFVGGDTIQVVETPRQIERLMGAGLTRSELTRLRLTGNTI